MLLAKKLIIYLSDNRNRTYLNESQSLVEVLNKIRGLAKNIHFEMFVIVSNMSKRK